MSRWYDEFATNCEGCGWLAQGSYLDGMPYLVCRWHGTIMTRQSDEECRDFRTPEQVRLYVARAEKRREKNARKK